MQSMDHHCHHLRLSEFLNYFKFPLLQGSFQWTDIALPAWSTPAVDQQRGTIHLDPTACFHHCGLLPTSHEDGDWRIELCTVDSSRSSATDHYPYTTITTTSAQSCIRRRPRSQSTTDSWDGNCKWDRGKGDSPAIRWKPRNGNQSVAGKLLAMLK